MKLAQPVVAVNLGGNVKLLDGEPTGRLAVAKTVDTIAAAATCVGQVRRFN